MPQEPAPQLAIFLRVRNENVIIPFSNRPSSFLCKLTDHLEAHYSNERFDVRELSRLLCLCPMQLHRKVKHHTGLSPGKYLLNFRLLKAMQLLQATDNTIGEVAWQTGFSSQNNFTRAFRRVFGSCPRQIRQKWN